MSRTENSDGRIVSKEPVVIPLATPNPENRPMNRPSPSRRRRRGFTMIELLVVVVIVGILMALLLPTIYAAYKNARDAGVVAEMNLLQNAIAQFKVKYGDYPPSRVLLVENGYFNTSNTSPPWGPPANAALGSVGWLTGVVPLTQPPIRDWGNGTIGTNQSQWSPSDLLYGQLAERSVRFLRKFWPRATFSTAGPLTGIGYDFNGNGVIDAAPIYLEGHEALVFFLGGIPNHVGSAIGMDGFAKNPANPFQNSANVPTSREASLFTFQGGRLIDDDLDGIPGYVDSLGLGDDARYYAYFSSYGQNGYDPNDVNFAEPDDLETSSTSAVARAFRVAFAVTNPPPNLSANFVGSFGPNPYTISDAVTATGSPQYQNPNSVQIISPGRDRHYGIGGQYLPNVSSTKLPFPDPTSGSLASGWWSAAGVAQEQITEAYRSVERENLGNFATTRLDY